MAEAGGKELRVLWAGERSETYVVVLKALHRIGRAVQVTTLEQMLAHEEASLAVFHRAVNQHDLVIADFEDGDNPTPNAVLVATLARFSERTSWIVLSRKVRGLPFDWRMFSPWEPTIEKLMFALADGVRSSTPPQKRVRTAQPQVFLAMPFQGLNGERPASCFDFSRILQVVRRAMASLKLDPDRQLLMVRSAPGPIMSDIEACIARASVIIADFSPDALSGKFPNPNVITEATLARVAYDHVKTLVAIAQKRAPHSSDDTEIPCAWGEDFPTLFYDPLHPDLAADRGLPLERALAERLRVAMDLDFPPNENRSFYKESKPRARLGKITVQPLGAESGPPRLGTIRVETCS